MSACAPEARKSILVVDDEPDVRMILEALLTTVGYSVTEACDGQEALDILANRKFDLMFLDLAMPRLSGEEVMKQLRNQECLQGYAGYHAHRQSAAKGR
jgi:CheY-like chemotaxis protein